MADQEELLAETRDLPEVQEPVAAAFPWPPRGTGWADAYARTWTECVFHPVRFFRNFPRDIPFGDTLTYFLPIAIAAAGIHLFWSSVGAAVGGIDVAERIGYDNPVTAVIEFLFSPLTALVGLFITAFVVHAVLWFFRGTHAGPMTTVRLLAFAYSPAVLAIVPGLGDVAGGIWMIVLVVIALREVHRARMWKAVGAVLVPLLILSILAAIAMAVGEFGGRAGLSS